MGSRPRYFQILLVDIESFGTRRNPIQQFLRTQLYTIIENAMAESGIDKAGLPVSDRGDGAFWLLPAAVSKVDITGRFIDALKDGLQAYGRVSSAEAAMRLRVALHAGEISEDERGWVGEDLNTACRLVDLQDLRETLAEADRAFLALAVSDNWHSAVVRHDYPGIDSREFLAVPFHVKEVRQTAWIRVPGYDRPPGIRAVSHDADRTAPGARGRPQHGSAAEQPAVADPRASYESFRGATIHAVTVYGGDHIEDKTGGSP
jgi:hypothetical protein